MKLDSLIGNQLLMAQAIFALAEHIDQSTGYALVPVSVAELPDPGVGQIACINDSTAAALGTVVSGGGTHTVLAWYNGTQWLVLGGAAPFTAAGQIIVANPTSTASTTYVMMGLGLSFTPSLARAFVTIDGQITNSNNGGETDAQLMYGLGVPPVFGVAPPAGATVIGTPIRYIATSGGGSFTPFSQSGLVTGLASGQQVWVGLALKVISGTGSVQDISLLAHELM